MADLHLGHERLISGWDGDGKGPRAEFGTTLAMFETIRDNARKVMTDEDDFYILGDIALKDSALSLLDEIPGRKRAVLGNHDLARPNLYARHFRRVYGAKVIEGGFVCTHIPIHPNSLDRKSMQINIHGHLHERVVTRDVFEGFAESVRCTWNVPDPRYVCVSCEQVNYTPSSLEEIEARVEKLGSWTRPEPAPLRPGTTYERPQSDHST